MVVARTYLPTAPASEVLKAALVLEDGSILFGRGFGAVRRVTGEVVFNTGMVGYLESLTDPSYYGQILVQTYPLIGNYGVPQRDPGSLEWFESDRVQPRGFVVADACRTPSHWSSAGSLHEWLLDQHIPGIEGIDTRDLTKKLRVNGTMLGILHVSTDEADADSLRRESAQITDPNTENLVREVSTHTPMVYGREDATTVVLVDCGVKYGILRSLLARGFRIVRLPYDSRPEDILKWEPKGVVVSNGPGDPRLCESTIKSTGQLIETGIPMLGICLGLQLVALALGADTYKMKFGHRGQNHPCLNLATGRAWMTSQNHGYAVDEKSLGGTGLVPSLRHLNDGTIEGIYHSKYVVRAVQFHPEASPGPTDAGVIFDEFSGDVKRYRA